jgi:hypothetical protein
MTIPLGALMTATNQARLQAPLALLAILHAHADPGHRGKH